MDLDRVEADNPMQKGYKGDASKNDDSIVSESLVLQRMKERRRKSDTKVEKALRQYAQDMKEDHALFVRYTLLDASVAVEERLPEFIDEVSIFPLTKPIHGQDRDVRLGISAIKVTSSVSIHFLLEDGF